MQKNTSIGIRIDNKLKKAAQKAANKERRSLSSLLEIALIKYLEKNKYVKKGDF